MPTRELGEKRDLASDILGLNSWVILWPNSVLDGCEMVSDMDIGLRLSMCSTWVQTMGQCEGRERSEGSKV